MAKAPKFSIIIPVYNVQNYLGECLNSVIQQTLQDIEIICVNDGSTDQSPAILELFQAKDDRIKIITKENGGLSSARNAGLQAASGDYICFLDSDDYLDRKCCETIYNAVLNSHPDIIGFGGKVFPDILNKRFWVRGVLINEEKDVRDNVAETLLFGRNRIYPFVWRNSFNREFLLEHHLHFDEHVRFGEDTVFQSTAFMFAKNAVILSEQLYNYRYDRKNSLMNKTTKDPYALMKEHIHIMDCIGHIWEQEGLLPGNAKTYAMLAMDFMGFQIPKLKDARKDALMHELIEVLRSHGAPDSSKGFMVRFKRIYDKYLKK